MMSRATVTHIILICGCCDSGTRIRVEDLGNILIRDITCSRCGMVGYLYVGRVVVRENG